MSPAKRIFANVIASYGRSLFALACGLFTSRWVLMALGEVDFGLYGLVGGLTAFISFLNGLLSMAVGRFYAYSVGEANRPGNRDAGLEECRKWFNTALIIHTAVPIFLAIVGYPLGEWAVRNFLTIPVEEIDSFVWVWRMVCLSCFVGMVSVPFSAMYSAKQEIAELTIYSFVTTTLNVCVLYYMVVNPRNWLLPYAFWCMLVSIVPHLIISIRAVYKYPECRMRREYFWLPSHLKKVLSFSGYRLINTIGMICSNQGQAIVVNKYLGPSGNAAMGIGNSVAAHSQNLAASIAGAFYPAITNAAGERKFAEMRELAMRTCKMGALAVLMFTIPLCFEIHEVMRIWLKTPPFYAAELCLFVLTVGVLEKVTDGHWMSIFAVGDIAGYQLVVSASGFLAIVFGWVFVALGLNIIGVGMALVIAKVFTIFVRLYFARRVASLSISAWAKSVLAPILMVSLISGAFAAIPVYFMEPSFTRICVTTFCCELVFWPLVWFLAFSCDERDFVMACIDKVRGNFFR